MAKGSLSFLMGILVVIQLPDLPSVFICSLIVSGGLLFCIQFRSWLLLLCVTGFLWGIFRAEIRLSGELPAEISGQVLQIQGKVKGLPLHEEHRLRFDLEINKIIKNGVVVGPRVKKVRLNWYGRYPVLQPDETWNLSVKLKQPHGFQNPSGFDYEAYLFQHNINATGYVLTREGKNYRVAKANVLSFDGVRYRLKEAITSRSSYHDHAALILALTIGDRSTMTAEQWRILTETGTSHLLAISGLHVGMIAGFVFFILRWFWSISGIHFCSIPAPSIAAVGAIIGAMVYAGMAGFSIPTQRALIMIVVTLFSLYFRCPASPIQILSLALFLVLMHDPFCILSAGFWLSFSAISILIYGMSYRVGKKQRLPTWLYGQVLLVAGMAPVMFFWFQQVPVVAGLANLFSVPWVSFITLPLIFLSTASLVINESFSSFALTMALISLDYLWIVLLQLDEFQNYLIHAPRPSPVELLFAITGTLILLVPRGIPGRWLGLCLMLPMLFPIHDLPAYGDYRVTVLEVGQGLAVVIETEKHTIVYDTGPTFSQSFNAGEDILLPYLRFRGIRNIDLLVISHGDLDHIGGLESLLQKIPIDKIISSVPDKVDHADVSRCVRGQDWYFDGITAEVLHPPVVAGFSGNNASCVVKLNNDTYSILLTGDIEKQAERYLAGQNQQPIRADFLIAPHHGSATSSTEYFLDAVQPGYVIFPVGHGNRFGFPKSDIIARYQRRGIVTLDTANSGAIELTLGKKEVKINQYALKNRRFWHSGNENL